MTRCLAVLLLLVGFAAAQELPPLPGEEAPASLEGELPPLPGEMPGGNDNLPPLVGETSGGGEGLPPLPGETTAGGEEGAALPPLPGEEEKGAAQPAAELPAVAGEEKPAAEAASPPVEAAGTTPAVEAVPRKVVKPKRKLLPKTAPNVIFGGYVDAPGEREEARLAWASQEILNALIQAGYELIEETGDYNPGGWRAFTFDAPRTDVTVHAYVVDAGRGRVWMRIGPAEPPAGESIARVVEIRRQHRKALRLMQAKLGRRLAPKGRTWEAPYERPVVNTARLELFGR